MRRFTAGRIAVFAVIVIGLILVEGNHKEPSPAASGTSFGGPAPTTWPSGNTLRVAAYNIAGGVGGKDNRFDLDRTAQALQGYELIGLEEVHGARYPGGPNQAEILGGKLNMPYLFAPVESQWWREAFGDGALTRLPIIHWQRIPLANAVADSNREVLWLQVRFAGKPMNVLITHLERHADRSAELGTVIALFKALQTPAILMGDLNSTEDDPQMQALAQDKDVADPILPVVMNSKDGQYRHNLDWIFLRGLRALNAGFTDNGASDHHLVWAEISAP